MFLERIQLCSRKVCYIGIIMNDCHEFIPLMTTWIQFRIIINRDDKVVDTARTIIEFEEVHVYGAKNKAIVCYMQMLRRESVVAVDQTLFCISLGTSLLHFQISLNEFLRPVKHT